MNLLFAFRYFKSKKSTNAINIIAWVSVLAIAVVTAAIIIVLSVFNGFEDLVKSLYGDFYADIKITATNNKSFVLNKTQFDNLKNVKGIAVYAGVIEEKAVAVNGEYQSIPTIKAVADNYASVISLQKHIVQGNYNLGNADKPQIVLGAGVQNALAVDVEYGISPIVLYLPNKKRTTAITNLESFNSATVQPVATFLVQQDFDNKYAFTNLAFMRYMLDMGDDEYTAIEIKVAAGTSAETVQHNLETQLGKGFKVETRYQQNRSLFKIMQAEKWFIFALLAFIMLIASFNIVGALTMLVLEKKKDIHILKAMGASNALIQKIFLTEGLLLAFIGGAIGIVIALIICLLQHFFHLVKLQGNTFVINYYPVKMQVNDFILTIAVIVVVSFLAAWIPSRKAATVAAELKS